MRLRGAALVNAVVAIVAVVATGCAIPTDVAVLSATSTAPNVVTVNFSNAFGLITGTATEQAVAQVVATVASETGVGTGVVFEIEGQRTSVPVSNGSLVAGPVYVFDFLNHAP